MVKSNTLRVILFTSCIFLVVKSDDDRKPLYKYRYETEDVMKTAASGVPVHGYHLVEGGYYPEPRFANFGGIPRSGNFAFGGLQQPVGPIGVGVGISPVLPLAGVGVPPGPIGLGAHGIHHHVAPIGGEYTDRASYQNGGQQHNDASYKKASGSEASAGKHEEEGFKHGEAKVHNGKGDTHYYHDTQGQKASEEDGKAYSGAQHFDKKGQNADEEKLNKGHKKGHVVKGFKTSHHKDETGHTEEYFDESNDEGGHYSFKGSAGKFGEEAQNAFKGGHEKGVFNAGQSGKQGHAQNVHYVDNSNGDKGDYANSKSYSQGQNYGFNNGVDQHSLLGHQESNKFFKNYPIHVPFYKAY